MKKIIVDETKEELNKTVNETKRKLIMLMKVKWK